MLTAVHKVLDLEPPRRGTYSGSCHGGGLAIRTEVGDSLGIILELGRLQKKPSELVRLRRVLFVDECAPAKAPCTISVCVCGVSVGDGGGGGSGGGSVCVCVLVGEVTMLPVLPKSRPSVSPPGVESSDNMATAAVPLMLCRTAMPQNAPSQHRPHSRDQAMHAAIGMATWAAC